MESELTNKLTKKNTERDNNTHNRQAENISFTKKQGNFHIHFLLDPN